MPLTTHPPTYDFRGGDSNLVRVAIVHFDASFSGKELTWAVSRALKASGAHNIVVLHEYMETPPALECRLEATAPMYLRSIAVPRKHRNCLLTTLHRSYSPVHAPTADNLNAGYS